MFPIKFLSSAHSRIISSEQGSRARTQGTEGEKDRGVRGRQTVSVMLINQKTMMSPMVSGPMPFNRLKANKGLTKELPKEVPGEHGLCKHCLMIHVKIDVGIFDRLY